VIKTEKKTAGRLAQVMLACILMASLGACATRPPASNPVALAAYEEAADPLEPFNRAMFKVDAGVDQVLVRPVVKVYRAIVPANGRKDVDNFVSNMRAPVTFANDLLQGEVSRAVTTLGRFVVNTGVGFFGFFDVGTKLGLEYHSEDFGQTLAVWGLPDGPYVYVPFIGPSTVRDGTGFGIDAFFIDPLAWYSRSDGAEGWVQWTTFGVTYVNAKDQFMDPLDELKKSSLDYYSALRSSYRQIRAKEIRNGAPPPMEDFE
jgi:phospholipid-binding lipoprotein MlaA